MKQTSKFQQLPPAMAMEILSRLSTKTLLNCRCVCKDWYSMISHPHFAHLQASTLPLRVLIKTKFPDKSYRKLGFTQIVESVGSDFRVEKMSFAPKTSLPPISFVSEFRMIYSCSGLLLLSVDNRDDPLYVCNPILGEFITITVDNNGRFGARSICGIGFSVETEEYKVLQSYFPNNQEPGYYLEAEIYTIGTGVWRSIGKGPGYLGKLPFNTYLHGALHWVRLSVESAQCIHSFNFYTEQFRSLPLPSNYRRVKSALYDVLKLGVLGGCLVLCVFGGGCSEFDMKVMKVYGVQESWTRILVTEDLYKEDFVQERCGMWLLSTNHDFD